MTTTALTLRAFYDGTYLPHFLCGAHPRTLDEYQGTLGAWTGT